MSRRRQIAVLAVLALAVPLRAVAGGGSPAHAGLSVSASLAGCGLVGSSIACEIDASWNQLDGADYYTASVTLADGSVSDFGQVGPGASMYVPYVGDGTYSVRVTAWGSPEPGHKPEVLERDTAQPSGTYSHDKPADPSSAAKPPTGEHQAGDHRSVDPSRAFGGGSATEPAQSVGDDTDPAAGTDTSSDPTCDPTPDDPPATDPATPPNGDAKGISSAQTQSAAETSADSAAPDDVNPDLPPCP